jgi:hypothetical protein
MAQQLRELGDVAGYTPGLVAGEQHCGIRLNLAQ